MTYDYGFIDIHNHIIPGVDDGAKDDAEALEMLKMAWNDNIRTICATPHFRPGFNSARSSLIERQLSVLKSLADKIDLDLKVFLGNELYYNEDAVDSLLTGKCKTLAGGHYVLVEFNTSYSFSMLKGGLIKLIHSGHWPILAHVERYDCIVKNEARITELVDMGVYMQVNADSVVSKKIFGIGSWVRHIISKDLVHFIATDCHNTETRPPQLLKCAKYLSKYGDKHVKRLLHDNPEHALRDEFI